MAYVKLVFVNDDDTVPINALNLDHMQTQYDEAKADLDAHSVSRTARVYHDASQSIADATAAVLAFNTERYDTDTIHDTVTNNSRLTCKTAGKYRITANVQWAANGTGSRGVYIRLNGVTPIAYELIATASTTLKTIQEVTTVYDLAVNDYVEMVVYQNSGGALNAETAANYSPEFMMERVG